MIDYQKIIEENRELELQSKDLEEELHRESVRERDLIEAQREIEYFKKQHSRKRVTTVNISILSSYVPDINRNKHYLRFFVNGKFQNGFHVEEQALETLTNGAQNEKMGDSWHYLIFTNKNN